MEQVYRFQKIRSTDKSTDKPPLSERFLLGALEAARRGGDYRAWLACARIVLRIEEGLPVGHERRRAENKCDPAGGVRGARQGMEAAI